MTTDSTSSQPAESEAEPYVIDCPPTTPPRSVAIFKRLGSYDFLSSDKDWSVELRVWWPDEVALTIVSELWPEADEPDIDDIPPSEVLDLISERLEEWCFSSGRDDKRSKISALRERIELIDDAWARKKIKGHEESIEILRCYLVQGGSR